MASDLQTATVDAPTSPIRLGYGLILFAFVLLFWSRYMPSPWTVLVADDWANLARSLFYDSHGQAFFTGLQDPNRPLSMAAVGIIFRLFGQNACYWTALSLLANALLVLFLMKMTLELTGRRSIAFLQVAFFILLPTLTETYHWSTQVLNEISCALVFYALSGWMWVAYVRRDGAWRLALSALAYAVGLFSYESGILLPAALLVLLPWRRAPMRSLLRLAPFGVVCLFYVAWRITDAFGMNESWHYPPHMEAGLTLWSTSWNIRELLHWWIGDHLFGAMLSGFQSFSTLPPWTRRLLVVGNVIAVVWVGRAISRAARSDEARGSPAPFSVSQALLFGVAWTGAAMAISVVSYTAPRLNVLPAMGIGLLLALSLARWPMRYWGAALLVPAVLALTSNQGTAESYRQVGELNSRLYAHLEQTVDDWRDKEVVLIDTRSLRNRLTPGLLRPVGVHPGTWAEYNNALLLRGFVPGGMVRLILDEPRHGIRVLHDVEYGARVEGNILHWHARYAPARPHTTPMSGVYVVDVHAVSVGK